MNDLLQLARERVVVYDGSMGATILNMQLTAEDYGGKEGCNEYLVLVQPHIIEGLHAGYLELGVDVIETDTFGGSKIKLEEYGLGDQTYELNRNAAELARGWPIRLFHRQSSAFRGWLDRADRARCRLRKIRCSATTASSKSSICLPIRSVV